MNERAYVLGLLADTVSVLRKLGDPDVPYVELLQRRVRTGIVSASQARRLMQERIRGGMVQRLESAIEEHGARGLHADIRKLKQVMRLDQNRRIR